MSDASPYPANGPHPTDDAADVRRPWVESLADRHADAPARVRAETAEDSRARSVLDALDATVAELATLRDGAGPGPSLPEDVRARLDRSFGPPRPRPTLPAPAAPPARRPRTAVAHGRGSRPGPGSRPGRGRRGGRLLAVATAGVAAVVAVALVVPSAGLRDTTSGTATAERVDLGDASDLGPSVLTVLGRSDPGPLQDPEVLAGCLRANGVPAGTDVLGSAQVDVGGRRGVLLLLPTGAAGTFTALVVGRGCSGDEAALIAVETIGGR